MVGVAAAAFLLLARPIAAQTRTADLMAQLEAYRFGGDAKVLDALPGWVADAMKTPAGRKQAAHALATVLQSHASFDAKSIACRWLVPLASDAQVPVLVAALRGDEHLAHYALMVLARIPGKTVDAALRRVLPTVTGNTRLEIIDMLGERHDAAAVPLLARVLASPDASVMAAVAVALAKLPAAGEPGVTRRIGQLLVATYRRAPASRHFAMGDAVLRFAGRAQQVADRAAALAAYRALDGSTAAPMLRAGALCGLVALEPDKAPALLLAALRDDRSPRQNMALDIAHTAPGAGMTRLLCAMLPKLTPRGRVLMIDALADRGDRSAGRTVLAACHDADAGTRTAALQALGALGGASAVPVLLAAAGSGAGGDRTAARTSLAALRGSGVGSRLIDVASGGPPSERAAAIQAIGDRGTPGATACLLDAAKTGAPEVRSAALGVLKNMGRSADLPELLDLMLAAPAGSRDDLTGAIGEIALRGTTEEERTGAILARLASVEKPADRADLLTLLGQIGGPRALQALRGALEETSADVQAAALQQLAQWPSDEAMPDLLRVVRATPDARMRAIALRGYVRMVGADEQRPPDQAFALYRDAAGFASGPDDLMLVLSGLSRVGSLEALRFAGGYLNDAAVRPEAELAAVQIAQSTIGAYPDQTKAVVEPIAKSSADPDTRKKASDLLTVAGNFGDYVTAWEVSPAYQKDGATFAQLQDIAFPPEEPGADKAVPWRLMPAGTNPDQPWLLDLLALWGGEQKVAYLRTNVWSETARDLVLELGSDDGAKLWWNGEMVFSLNVARGVAPAENKVSVHAKAGWNTLLFKVTQNIMGWGACARFTNPDGTPATGLRFAAPSAAKATQ